MVCEGNLLSHGVAFGKVTFDGKPVLKIKKGSHVTLGENFVCKSGRNSGSIGNRSHSIISVNVGGGTFYWGEYRNVKYCYSLP